MLTSSNASHRGVTIRETLKPSEIQNDYSLHVYPKRLFIKEGKNQSSGNMRLNVSLPPADAFHIIFNAEPQLVGHLSCVSFNHLSLRSVLDKLITEALMENCSVFLSSSRLEASFALFGQIFMKFRFHDVNRSPRRRHRGLENFSIKCTHCVWSLGLQQSSGIKYTFSRRGWGLKF